MQRQVSPVLVLWLLLACFAALAWLSRHPDAEILVRAQRWPVIGPLAAQLRAAYLQPARADAQIPEIESPTGVEIVLVPADADELSARPHVWVEAGTTIHQHPSADSPILDTLPHLANLSLLQRQGEWYRVRRPRPGSSAVRGWVHLQGYQESSSVGSSSEAEPVLPLPASPPDLERIRAARSLMDAGGREEHCGPYLLFTDVVDQGLLAACGCLATEIEVHYRQRYGLQPVGEPAEAVLLFARFHTYRSFRDSERVKAESNLAHAYPARGYVALYFDQRPREQVLATLAHELTHLINRRSIGPALPPWLSEGLADDLAESRIDADGRLWPGTIGGRVEKAGPHVVRWGGTASALLLASALERNDLPPLAELVRLEGDEFHRDNSAQAHYALSSFWIRYLLSDSESPLATGFQSFLRAVAGGAAISGELLHERLGVEAAVLERGFRDWLRARVASPMAGTTEATQ